MLDHDLGTVSVAHPNGRLHRLERYRITSDRVHHPSGPVPLLALAWAPASAAAVEP